MPVHLWGEFHQSFRPWEAIRNHGDFLKRRPTLPPSPPFYRIRVTEMLLQFLSSSENWFLSPEFLFTLSLPVPSLPPHSEVVMCFPCKKCGKPIETKQKDSTTWSEANRICLTALMQDFCRLWKLQCQDFQLVDLRWVSLRGCSFWSISEHSPHTSTASVAEIKTSVLHRCFLWVCQCMGCLMYIKILVLSPQPIWL